MNWLLGLECGQPACVCMARASREACLHACMHACLPACLHACNRTAIPLVVEFSGQEAEYLLTAADLGPGSACKLVHLACMHACRWFKESPLPQKRELMPAFKSNKDGNGPVRQFVGAPVSPKL